MLIPSVLTSLYCLPFAEIYVSAAILHQAWFVNLERISIAVYASVKYIRVIVKSLADVVDTEGW